jgi:hypothetical protein
MFNSIKRLRTLAALPVIGAIALVAPMAAPAGAATSDVPVGAGVASGIVAGTFPATTACITGGGYVFGGVAIAGATVATNAPGVPVVGSAAVTAPNPAGKATSDPLNGTPLGCDASPNVWQTVAGAAGAGTPLVGCPVGATCGSGAGFSNILADEGVVLGAPAPGSGQFGCAAGSAIGCALSGTFVRFGGMVLVSLQGCIAVNGTCPVNASPHNADVVLAA